MNATIPQKVQFLLNQLVTNSGIDALSQLALLTKVRQELANPTDPPDIGKLLEETNVLTIINQILAIEENHNNIVKYLKLEATWILTNIGYGTEEDITELFKDEYELVGHINRILQGNDIQLID